jgi:hypothetical protein
LGHVLMDHCSALVVDVDPTEANGAAERESALRMLARSAPKAKSLAADKNNDTAAPATRRPAKIVVAHGPE